jgi:Flp pilus assembly protein TadD
MKTLSVLALFAFAIMAALTLPAAAQDATVVQARSLRLSGKVQESISVLKPYVSRSPANYLAHYNLGLAYSNTGDQAAAIRELKLAKDLKAKDKGNTDGTIYNSLGWIYLQAGDYTHAVEELRLAKEPSVYAALSPVSKQKVDNNLALAESYLKIKLSTPKM